MSEKAMTDWSLTLRINAVSCQLAKSIYEGACEVYAPDAVAFEQLPARLKDHYIQLAADVLARTAAKPTPPSDLSGKLFNLGVALARRMR